MMPSAGEGRTRESQGDDHRFDAADALVRHAVEEDRIPGGVLHVIAEREVVHQRAFGRRHVMKDDAVTLDDLFPVASLMKPIVAVGILQLCDEGLLRLDDEIERYLPEFSRPTVLLRYDPGSGAITTRLASGSITVRHLLTHTAGIHHGFPSADDVMGGLYERSGVVHDNRTSMDVRVRRLGPLPLVHDPGRAWTYGLSSDVAGHLIEVVSGQPLDRYLDRRLFEPLGMRATHFSVPAAERHRLVTQHARDRDGIAPAFWADNAASACVSGGGGLHTTVSDYGRFVQMLLDGGSPVASRESIEAMTRNQIGDLTAMGLRYGLSLGLSTNEARGRVPLPVGGFGWYGISGVWFWTIPRRPAAVLFFSNIYDSGMNLSPFSRIAGAIETVLGEDSR